ncbi:MAG: protein kinase, partial [Hyphomicrobiaceae bacterium]
VRVYRYFRANNTAYMVLHFEEGQHLKGWLKSLGRAPRQKELDAILAPLLDALELIHAADYLHRDIAPDNIMVRKNGQPVLIDFGSARGEIAQHSKTVSALVKPGYSPYEQYAETSRRQGPWTDIYALGATLYHAVTGKRPPDAPSRMVHDEIVPAREAALSSYRPSFLKAIDRALSLEIGDRPQSIQIWRGELLAPEPPRQGWLTRALERKAQEEQEALSRSPLAEALDGGAHPPPPDSPGPQGGLLDFVDNLKGGAPAPAASPAPADKPEKVASGQQAPLRARLNPFSREKPEAPAAGSEQAAGGARKSAEAAQPQARARSTPEKSKSNADAAAAKPSAELVAVPAKRAPAKRARDPKPRPIRTGNGIRLRPILVKLTIGAVVAGAAVLVQNRLPQLAIETRGLPSSAERPARSPQVAMITAHSGGVRRILYDARGERIVSIGADNTLKVWRTSNAALVRTIPLDAEATSIAVSGDEAITGFAIGRIDLWDLSTGRRRATFLRNEADFWSLAFSDGGGRFAAATHDWKIALWDTKTQTQPMHILEGHGNSVQALSYSAEGSLLASGGADKTVRLWNISTLDLVRTYRGGNDFVSDVTVSPDGKHLAAASLDGSIRVWSTGSSRLKRRYSGHRGAVSGLAFAPDGQRLASAGNDGTVRLWDLGKRRSVRAFAGHRSKVDAVTFSPDGHHVASAGDDGTIRIWALDAQQVAAGR